MFNFDLFILVMGSTIVFKTKVGAVYINDDINQAAFPSAVLFFFESKEHFDYCRNMLKTKSYENLKPVFWSAKMVEAFKAYDDGCYSDNPFFQEWLGNPLQSLLVIRLLDDNLKKEKGAGLAKWVDQVDGIYKAVEKVSGRGRNDFLEEYNFSVTSMPKAVFIMLNPNATEILVGGGKNNA